MGGSKRNIAFKSLFQKLEKEEGTSNGVIDVYCFGTGFNRISRGV